MIYSMTGFGRSEFKSSQGILKAEIKSVNSKFSEISIKSASYLQSYDEFIRSKVQSSISRGKISVYLSCPESMVCHRQLYLDKDLARKAYRMLHELSKIIPSSENQPRAVSWKDVASYPGVITDISSDKDQDRQFTSYLSKTLDQALASFKKFRAREGKALAKDILKHITFIKNSATRIKKRLPKLHQQYKESLSKRMSQFMNADDLDRTRLTQDVASYIKNSDVSEELTRLGVHAKAIESALRSKEGSGKKMDFIAQEMQREANTLGSKSQDAMIAQEVINIKSAIDKIREQVQNVE